MGNILNIINSDEHFHNLNDFGKSNYMRCLDGTFLSSEIKPHFGLTICNVDSIDETKKYLYIIECRTKDAIYSAFLRIPPVSYTHLTLPTNCVV